MDERITAWEQRVKRHYQPLVDELIIRGIEDAHVENSGGHVMVVTGTLPNGWHVDATAEGFSISDEDGDVLTAAYATLRAHDGVAEAPDYYALAIEDEDGRVYSGVINEDSAAMAAHVILSTFRTVTA